MTKQERKAIPLSPFEEYMARDEKPEYPMTGQIYGDFEGHVNHAVFEEALRLLVAKEPLLNRTIVRRWRRFYWQEIDAPPLMIQWEKGSSVGADDDREGSCPLCKLDISREPGYKLIIQEGPESFRLIFAMHHTCGDGVSMGRFLGSLFSIYEALREGREPDAKDFPEPELVQERENLHLPPLPPVPFFTGLFSFLRAVAHWLFSRPTPLRLPIACEFPRQQWHICNVEATEALKERGRRYEVSPNTMVLCDTFYKINEYFLKVRKKRRGTIRILIPVNFRNEYHDRFPSTNLLGYVFIDRPIGFQTGEKELAQQIQKAINYSKERQTAMLFTKGICLFRPIPGALRLLTSRLFCHATCVVSNVGVYSKVFSQERYRNVGTIETVDCRLVRFYGGPPLRVHTDVCIGLITHLRELTVTVTDRSGWTFPAQ
ncbi:MAG: condensation domain-containing protein [Planctomycetia bacterium]|nr:condensation domain-containing protein [Planctomycetia bacterium]